MTSTEGPKIMGYHLAPLPVVVRATAINATGLFRISLDADESKAVLENFQPNSDLSDAFPSGEISKLPHLVSESVVLFEIHLVKLAADGISLEYLNTDAQVIKLYGGKWTLGVNHPQDIMFLEVTLGLLPKSSHDIYHNTASIPDKKAILNKSGIRLSRLVPWRP
jgi:hypothetical protein